LTDPILELDCVELRFGARLAASAPRLTVQRGEWLALVGPNASGKTTLLRCIVGRLPPANGVVKVGSRSLYPVASWRGHLPGYAVPPDELPPFLSVRQCLEIYANAHGAEKVPDRSEALCRDLGLLAHEHELIRNLSLGTRQKLAVVLALLTEPSVLALDEVFNGLDIGSALVLKRFLRECVERQGLTVLLATHALDVVVDCCSRLVLLDGGKLVLDWNTAQLRRFSATSQLELALADALGGIGR
jgi:ABC-2 type transport system ATP-binding protein